MSSNTFLLLTSLFLFPRLSCCSSLHIVRSQMTTLEVRGTSITIAAKGPHGNLLVWLSSKTCSLNYYFIPHIFKSLGDLSFGCSSDNISMLGPSLTPRQAHFMFIKHLKYIPMSGPLDLLFPGPGKLPLYISGGLGTSLYSIFDHLSWSQYIKHQLCHFYLLFLVWFLCSSYIHLA